MRISKEQMDAMADAYFAIPREAPTIEERRAALRVGEVITDPALLCKGMRVQGGGMIDARTIGDNGRPTEGGYDLDWYAAGWKHIVEEVGVRFLGWAQEEKAGERPLCDGPTEGNMSNLLEAKPPTDKPDPTPAGLSSAEAIKNYWEKGIVIEPQSCDDSYHASQGGKWNPCEAADCHFLEPSPPPRGLPFVYYIGCIAEQSHDGKTMCLSCEDMWGRMTSRLDYPTNPTPQRPEPHRPSDTGMGGACGPVMGRLR